LSEVAGPTGPVRLGRRGGSAWSLDPDESGSRQTGM